MSNDRTWSLPDRAPARAAPTAPAAGPDRTAQAAWRPASAAEVRPPFERMISGSGRPASMARRPSRSRYPPSSGDRYASITVVDVRSYSRKTASRSCDADTCTPGSRSATASATRRSCSGRAQEWIRQTATDSTSRSASCSRTPASESSSSGVRTSRGVLRSTTPKRSSGGTSGDGRAAQRRYSWGRVWRASSITSVKPSVEISAVRAPRSSSSAFVATVMPCAKCVTWLESVPARSSASETAAITPSDWSAGVVGTFAVTRRPAAASTASVKVPPTSTPSAQPSDIGCTGLSN